MQLVQSLYSRTEAEFNPGNFRIKGDIVEIYPSYADDAFRIHFFGDEIEEIESFDVKNSKVIEDYEKLDDLSCQYVCDFARCVAKCDLGNPARFGEASHYFKEIGKNLEAKRLEERTNFDLEMIRELGYCSGIENYSRYLDGDKPGTRPFCLLIISRKII
jgi:excinuclease ABC subunit B